MKKKLTAVLLFLALVLSLSGCSLLKNAKDKLGIKLDNPFSGLFSQKWEDPIVEGVVREYLGVGEDERIDSAKLKDFCGLEIAITENGDDTRLVEAYIYNSKACDAFIEDVLEDDISDENAEIINSGSSFVSFETDEVFTTLSDFSNFPNLSVLFLTNHGITDIRNLADCTKLQLLCLDDNAIEDVSPVSSMKELRFLSLWNNKVTDISPLSSLSSLVYLDLEGNEIISYMPLVGLSSLDYLFIDEDSISNLDYASITDALPNCNIA